MILAGAVPAVANEANDRSSAKKAQDKGVAEIPVCTKRLGTITVLMRLVRFMSFLPFAIYRVALGVILLALIYSGIPLGAVN